MMEGQITGEFMKLITRLLPLTQHSGTSSRDCGDLGLSAYKKTSQVGLTSTLVVLFRGGKAGAVGAKDPALPR